MKSYRHAVELCPSSSKAHFPLGFGLSAIGRCKEAIAAVNRACEFSPRDPMNWSFHTVRALSYMYSGDFKSAATAADWSRRNPQANHWAPLVQASSLAHLGRFEEAIQIIESVRKSRPDLRYEQ